MPADPAFSHFVKFLRPHWLRFSLVVVASMLSAVLSIVYPFVLKRAVDGWTTGADAASLLPMIAALGVALITQTAVSYISQYSFIKLTQRVLAEVRTDLLRRVMARPISFFSREREGYVVSVFLNDINTINEMLTGGVLSVLVGSITLLAVLGSMLYLQWQTTLILSVFMVIFVLVYALFGPKVKTLSGEYHQRLGGVTESLHETYSGIRIVKLFGMEDTVIARFGERINDSIRAFEALTRRGLLMTETSGLVTGLTLLVALALGGALVSDGRMSLGSAMAYFTLLSGAFGPLKGLVGANVRYKTAAGAAVRVAALMGEEVPPADERDRLSEGFVDETSPAVEFRDVHFGYAGVPLFDGATFEIASGERVLMRGESGAGKSTLLELMLQFQEAGSGEIRFFGNTASDLGPNWIRSNISVVPQAPFLFNVSLRENLVLANPTATEDEIRSAIEAVGLDALVSRLSDGLDTQVGERGSMLSGGEKQRVAIVRAILKAGSLVVFDEATAWLDPATERQMWSRIVDKLGNRTILLVSHNEYTSFPADRTLFVGAGRVTSVATPQASIA